MLKPSRLPSPLVAGHVDECAFAGVAKQPVLADAGDENIGKAVVVVIADGHAHAVEFNVESGVRGHVGERAVAVVVIEPQRGALLFCGRASPAPVDQQNVLPAVAVVVEKGAAGAESLRQKFAAVSSAVVLELNSGLLP